MSDLFVHTVTNTTANFLKVVLIYSPRYYTVEQLKSWVAELVI